MSRFCCGSAAVLPIRLPGAAVLSAMLFSSGLTAPVLPLQHSQGVSPSWKIPLVLRVQDCCQKRHHFIVTARPRLRSRAIRDGLFLRLEFLQGLLLLGRR